jgi:hypothetical protein
MNRQVRTVLLAGAALVAIAPSSRAAALSHTTADQSLTWAIVPSANVHVLDNTFQGISCPSASACTAVGYYQGRRAVGKTLIESWNGTAWSIVPSPSKPSHNILQDVSCSSASACTAVGYSYGPHSEPKTLIESWNGTSWSIVPSPSPGPRLGQDYLDSVSCPSASFCTAVGFRYPAS